MTDIVFYLRNEEPTEDDEQCALFLYATMMAAKDNRWQLLNSSQNGLPLCSLQQGRRAKAAGIRKGYPDVFLPVACCGYHGLFIELKRRSASMSSVSEVQKGWLAALTNQGYHATVAFGCEEAIHIINGYLKKQYPIQEEILS